MGGSSFSRDDYDDRVKVRAATSTPVFKHTADIKSGKVASKTHPSLDPKGVKLRESRDSDQHPVTVPIMIILDTTGSMAEVPAIIQSKLPLLMGHFLEDKASGKKYLGDGYPAILIGAVDDFDAQYSSYDGEGSLQVGQFESGMEIDQNLENLWLTGNGGGTYHESYELAIYFAARKTAHDHMDKREKKGYLFIIGDEHAYAEVGANQVQTMIGDKIQANIPFQTILDEAKELYHVFFILPNMTQHYNDVKLEAWWQKYLGQQNMLKLASPDKICEMIVSAIAICEEHAGLDDLVNDGLFTSHASAAALVPLSQAQKTGAMTKHSAKGLPDIKGTGATERL